MGRAITFMVTVWIIVVLAGGVVQGDMMAMSSTPLLVDIDDDDDTVTVISTEGYPDTGFIVITDERIGYGSTTNTTFEGTWAQPMVRGAQDTTAVAHTAGEQVRTVESSMLNQSLGYKLAVLSDPSGLLAFVTIPYTFITLLASFFILPLSFLGTDMEILTFIWAAISLGLIVSIGVALAGGRRV